MIRKLTIFSSISNFGLYFPWRKKNKVYILFLLLLSDKMAKVEIEWSDRCISALLTHVDNMWISIRQNWNEIGKLTFVLLLHLKLIKTLKWYYPGKQKLQWHVVQKKLKNFIIPFVKVNIGNSNCVLLPKTADNQDWQLLNR